MGDSRITVRLDEDRKRRLDEDNAINVSGLVRDLLDAYDLAGDSMEAGLKRRLKDEEQKLDRLRRELTEVQSEVEKQERVVDELQEKIKQRQEAVPEEVVEFAERIKSGRFNGDLEPENPAVNNWAGNAGIHPEKFVREVEQRL